MVSFVLPMPVTETERRFTGTVAARVQSNLGFRVAGKIVERAVIAGQQVKAGQLLMRIDPTDLQLALTAKRNAAAAARAVLVQATADEKRYAVLAKSGFAASPRQYEQARAGLDTAAAQLAAAEAAARVAENEANYAQLLADADGTVMETLAEPGQVVSAGQPVVRLAKAGPREALVSLPETVRPEIGSLAEARLFGSEASHSQAQLRQLSDSADAQSRTYEARYVLEGPAASAPLGATVTLRLATTVRQPEVEVPLGAILDDGLKTGVWILDNDRNVVTFRAVKLVRVTGETAIVAGIAPGEAVVSLGAHLLQNGARVRTATRERAN